ncbi:Solute carrier family 2, facilitated glucose transporter member 2 [Hondaea fermentalgiana]|uniref:Hexose transporter 1 n=1 Tax=Hondaea fermentalgiana TaxID=2315210 RepID=A0A2R5FYU0_9STRA|nr:Solute carrier family 2, facilitated glucose transporter member 2 [Hondaea fermentalgiana]|eukprot:GBG23922.1 Solute carrier family 2, facilitated glucose transporter member 2 [Hondaea fermentalgiana]
MLGQEDDNTSMDITAAQPNANKKPTTGNVTPAEVAPLPSDAPQRKLNAYTLLILLAAILGGMIFGLDIGTAATMSNRYFRQEMGIPVLEPGQKDSDETTNQISQFTYIFHIATLVGAPFAGYITDRLGRKLVINLAAAIFLAGSIWQVLAGLISPDFAWESVILGRAVGGIGNGFILTMAPVYTAELAPAEWRGKSITFFQLAITIGIFVMAIYNERMEDVEWGWRLGIALQCIPCALIILLTVSVLPESPRWLIKMGRHDEAETALRKLAAGTPEADKAVSYEMNQIRAEVDAEESVGQGTFGELFQRENLPSLLCGAGVAFSQNVTGVNFFMSYATTLFNSLDLDPFTYDLGLKAVNVMATFIALPLIDRMGRKFLTVWGTFFTVVAFFLIGIVIVGTGVDVNVTDADSKTRSVQLFCVAMVFLFQVVFACTLGPLGWVVPSEAYPLRLRGVGMSFSVSSNIFTNIILGDVGYLAMYSATSLQAMMFICVGLNLVVTVPTVIFLQPETKGLSMEDLRKVFAYEKGGNAAKGHGTLAEFYSRNFKQTMQIFTCRAADTSMGMDRFKNAPNPSV